jgi:hypothetical protein
MASMIPGPPPRMTKKPEFDKRSAMSMASR